MSPKNKDILFVCQITDLSLRVVKFTSAGNAKKEIKEVEFENISPDINNQQLVEKLGRIFKTLGYDNNRVILSLPRSKATCRYLKIPSASPQEIDKIVSLQAPAICRIRPRN